MKVQVKRGRPRKKQIILKQDVIDPVSKKIKDDLFYDTLAETRNEFGAHSTPTSIKETGDCFVRATMAAFGINYDKAHLYVASNFKRKDNQGTRVPIYINKVIGKTLNGKKWRIKGANKVWKYWIAKNCKPLTNPEYSKPTQYTVKTFMEQNSKGRFILIVKGHALALVNGRLYGNHDEVCDGFRRPLLCVIEAK